MFNKFNKWKNKYDKLKEEYNYYFNRCKELDAKVYELGNPPKHNCSAYCEKCKHGIKTKGYEVGRIVVPERWFCALDVKCEDFTNE